MPKFERLFQPITIGNLQLRNRIVQLAMELVYTTDEGHLTPIYENFMLERAKGGVGLINTSVQTRWPGQKGYPGLYSDEFIPPFRKLIEGIHSYGAKFSAQLQISLRWSKGKGYPVELVGPSDVVVERKEKPRPLTIDEIHQTVEDFGKAAGRARQAGFDAIEIHSGMGGLSCQFLSSATNKRTDDYGGPIEKRMRFLLELIESIKKNAGNDFPIICRFSAEEFMEGSNTMDESRFIARRLEEVGISAINVQIGWHVSTVPMIQQWVAPAAWADIAYEIKKVVKIPVVAAYRIAHPAIAERVLAEGKADLVGMGRALISDPELPNKAREGRVADIRYCTVCCRCVDDSLVPQRVTCSVNAAAGRMPFQPATESKKVLVIGGGPGGMEAARVAALRGHKVILVDKGKRLGGLMVLGCILNKEIEPLVGWMSRQVRSLPIDVRLRTEATPALVEKLKPDAVIVAVGGTPITLDVPGAKGRNVISGHDMQDFMNGISPGKGKFGQRFLWSLASFIAQYFYRPSLMRRALGSNMLFGNKIVIIGGQFAGLELALALGERKKKVTVLEETNRVGTDIGMVVRWVQRIMLKKAGVEIETLAKVTEVTDKGVKTTREDGKTQFFEADMVFSAPGTSVQANPGLAKALEGKAPVIYSIGDCVQPGKIREAVAAGYETASKI